MTYAIKHVLTLIIEHTVIEREYALIQRLLITCKLRYIFNNLFNCIYCLCWIRAGKYIGDWDKSSISHSIIWKVHVTKCYIASIPGFASRQVLRMEITWFALKSRKYRRLLCRIIYEWKYPECEEKQQRTNHSMHFISYCNTASCIGINITQTIGRFWFLYNISPDLDC